MAEQQAVLDFFLDRLSGYDGVALAAVYGSFGTPDATPGSDVDMFFVPSDDVARAAMFQVVVDDIGHDLWPLDWSRLQRIAALEDTLTSLLLDARVVLGGAEAVNRFEGLRDRCRATLGDHSARAAAAGRLLDAAAAKLGRLDGDERLAVASATGPILTAAAYLEGCYLRSGPGRVLDAGADWLDEELRRNLLEALTGATTADRLQAARRAIALAEARRRSVLDHSTPPLDADGRVAAVAGTYEEVHSLLAKVPRAVAARQLGTARLAAADGCREAGAILHMLDAGRWPHTAAEALQSCRAHGLPDLCSGQSADDLSAAAGEVDRKLAALLLAAGVRLRVVDTVSELKAEDRVL